MSVRELHYWNNMHLRTLAAVAAAALAGCTVGDQSHPAKGSASSGDDSGSSGDDQPATTVDAAVAPVGDPISTARCQVRVSIALTGTSPDADLLAATDPTSLDEVNRLLATTAFRDRFAGFITASFNDGATDASEIVYALAHHVLEADLPWAQLFVGPFAIDPMTLAVSDDAAGLGYFNDPTWMAHYAGSEPAGYQLRTANRILLNLIGVVKLVQVQNTATLGSGRDARQQPPCSGCHYDTEYGLDRIAGVIPLRTSPVGTSPVTFGTDVPDAGGDTVFLSSSNPANAPYPTGLPITSERGLLNAMVTSAQFRFNACRNAYLFLYGRNENQSEAATFAGCLSAMEASGKLTDGIAAIVHASDFCL